MTDSFWRDPPWRGGKGGYRMGLRPIEPRHWLPDRITESERARKIHLLTDPDSGVFAELDASRAGQRKVLEAVRRFTATGSSAPSGVAAPLVDAALLVPDDLCVMERTDRSYRLTAACVCSPSYWRLADKIGRTLDGIHDPVPTLNDKLGASMVLFLSRLPIAAVFERRNWLIHTNPELFQPHPEVWRDLSPADVGQLIIRSERQTLHRLDHDAVAFTIRVTCRPFIEIRGYPEAARDLSVALDSLDSAERSAKGYRHFEPVVSAYLHSII